MFGLYLFYLYHNGADVHSVILIFVREKGAETTTVRTSWTTAFIRRVSHNNSSRMSSAERGQHQRW